MSDLQRFQRRQADLKARAAANEKTARAAQAEREAAEKAVALTLRKRENKRAQRERDKAKREAEIVEIAGLLGDLPPIEPKAERLAADERALVAWLATPGREQGALRKLERDTAGTLMMSWRVLLTFRLMNESLAEADGVSVDPGLGTFARLLSEATGRPWSKDQARRRLSLLRSLELITGPFSPDFLAKAAD